MKLREFQAHLQREKIDLAFLAVPDSHITYFTQIKPSAGFLLITPTTATLHLSVLDFPPFHSGFTTVPLEKNWEKKLGKSGKMKIGINKNSLTISLLERLKMAFPKAQFLEVGQIISELRSRKTPEEIAKIRKACSLTVLAFHALVKEFPRKVIRTEREVALFLERFLQLRGATLAFPTIVASGKNSATPHHVTSSQRLEKGFLQLDFGASYEGYCADMSRVMYLGKPQPEERQHYELLRNIQQQTIREISEQKRFSLLEQGVRKRLGKQAVFFTHSLGHGVGIDIHEAPVYTEAKVEQFQVFTLEPGLYFPGKYGIRIEDTLLYDQKVEVLTPAPKELMCFPIS